MFFEFFRGRIFSLILTDFKGKFLHDLFLISLNMPKLILYISLLSFLIIILIYCHVIPNCDRYLVVFSNLQYDSVGWAPKEYNADDKQCTAPAQTGTEVGAPQSGFVWDEASGYYYDAASGFYYDGNTGMFLV